MTQIPVTPKGKRPSFFDESAVDQIVTMMLEVMAELWVVKERVYTLEKVLDEAGMAATAKRKRSRTPRNDALGPLMTSTPSFPET